MKKFLFLFFITSLLCGQDIMLVNNNPTLSYSDKDLGTIVKGTTHTDSVAITYSGKPFEIDSVKSDYLTSISIETDSLIDGSQQLYFTADVSTIGTFARSLVVYGKFYGSPTTIDVGYSVSNTAYYVASYGSHDTVGISASNPFTIQELNQITLVPGDTIYTFAGDTLASNSTIRLQGSGTASEPIYWRKYGTGDKTIISNYELIDSTDWSWYSDLGSGSNAIDTTSSGASADDQTIDVGDYSSSYVTTNMRFGQKPTDNTRLHSMMIFRNINVPSGAALDSAKIEFIARATDSYPNVYTKIAVENSLSPASCDGTYANYSGRTYFTKLDWDISGAWTAESKYLTNDIASLVRQWVQISGYTAGTSDMAVAIEDDYSSHMLKDVYSYDGSATKSPRLYIWYSDAGGRVYVVTATTSINGGQILNGHGYWDEQTLLADVDDTNEVFIDGQDIYAYSPSGAFAYQTKVYNDTSIVIEGDYVDIDSAFTIDGATMGLYNLGNNNSIVRNSFQSTKVGVYNEGDDLEISKNHGKYNQQFIYTNGDRTAINTNITYQMGLENGKGIEVGYGASDTEILANSFKSSLAGVGSMLYNASTTTTVSNNAFYFINSSGYIVNGSSAPSESDNNGYAGSARFRIGFTTYTTAPTYDAAIGGNSSVIGDFSWIGDEDYTIPSTSRLVNAGKDVGLTTDYLENDYNYLNNGFDIGAYEYQGVVSAVATADPNATALTLSTLQYITDIGESGDLLSGQQSAWIRWDDEYDEVYTASGKYTAVLGLDFRENNNTSEIDEITTEAIAHAKAGGIVTVSSHQPNLETGEYAKTGDGIPVVDIVKAVTPGEALNDSLNQDLVRIYDRLKPLADSNVVVLFRPLHEMNGGWFWWGNKPRDDFKALWQYYFTYLTDTLGLHNLLWVYAPNGGATNVTEWYPGDDYVDIVGLDYYRTGDRIYKIQGYDEILTLGKPFAITEYGQWSYSTTPPIPRNTQYYAIDIKTNMPKTAYWLTWGGDWKLSFNLYLNELMNNYPIIINRSTTDIQ